MAFRCGAIYSNVNRRRRSLFSVASAAEWLRQRSVFPAAAARRLIAEGISAIRRICTRRNHLEPMRAYVAAPVAVVVGADFAFFRHRF